MIQQEFNGLYRYDDRGERFYARVKDGKVIWYPSVTRIIKATSPTPAGLMAWYAKHGFDEANKLKDDAAERGTQMHRLIEDYLRDRYVDLTDLPEFQAKALLAFHTFARDVQLHPIHTERVIYNDELIYAGACDLICAMQWKGNMITALIDFKSGSNVYDDYAVQLEMYRLAAVQQGFPIVKVFNWSPKDWRKEPTYTLTDQTAKCTLEEVLHRCKLFHATNDPKPRARMAIRGTLPNNYDIITVDPDEVIMNRQAQTVEFADIQTPPLAGNYIVVKTPDGPRVFLDAEAVEAARAAGTSSEPA